MQAAAVDAKNCFNNYYEVIRNYASEMQELNKT
jgi:hypothetical protein